MIVPRKLSAAGIPALGLLLCLVVSLAPASADDTHAPEVVAVENDLLRVACDRQRGTLLELTDRRARQNLVGDAGDAGDAANAGDAGDDSRRDGLWELDAVIEGRPALLVPSQAESFRVERIAPPQAGLRLIWEGFPTPGTSKLRVEATVELDPEASTSRWKIAVEKPGAIDLRRIRFPRVFGLRKQDDERLAVPAWMGQLLPNPRSVLSGTSGKGRRLAWTYPGRLSMQCLAYYGAGGQGFYAACEDPNAARKTLAFWGAPGGKVHFEVAHYPLGQTDQSNPNEAAVVPQGPGRYTLPYHVVLGTFQGDWFTAAQRYRTWATRQRWAQESRLQRGLVPDWVLDTGMWVWNRGPSPGVLVPAAVLQEELGLPVRVFWHWWHGCPYDIGFPEYLPPREGTEPFQQAIARAHDAGLRTLIYMNQRAWGMSTKSWKEMGAERFAVKAEDGKVRPEVYNIFTKQALASMCLATPFWRNHYAGLAEEAFKDLGVDGIYMDQACSHRPCYDPNHGHPRGGGESWIQGFRTLAADIRGRCNAKRTIALAGEGCGEAWLEHLDLMLTLQVSQERYASPNNPWEVIPFFHAVYHPYAVTYGSYSSLTMPPYDVLWPAEFAPKKPLVLLDRKYAHQFYLEHARAFVWGQQPTLANFLPEHLRLRSEEIAYVMRLARVRSRAAKYLLRGEFLRPPELGAPEAVSDFSRLSIYAGQKSRLTAFTKRHPLALAQAWKAPDGQVAIAITSMADEPLSLELAIPAKSYGLKEPRQVSRIDATGRRRLGKFDPSTPRLKLELPAREAWILEFSGK